MAEPDQEAPYGRHPDGTPKRSNGGRPRGTARAGSKKPTGKAGRAPSPTRRATANTPPRKTDPAPDYSAEIAGAVSLFGLAFYKSKPLVAAVFFDRAEIIGSATNDFAKTNEHVRKLCEKAALATPATAFAMVLLGTVAQIAEVERWSFVPEALPRLLGATPRDQFIAEFEAKQQAAADQAAGQMDFGPVPDDAAPFTRTDYSDRAMA